MVRIGHKWARSEPGANSALQAVRVRGVAGRRLTVVGLSVALRLWYPWRIYLGLSERHQWRATDVIIHKSGFMSRGGDERFLRRAATRSRARAR